MSIVLNNDQANLLPRLEYWFRHYGEIGVKPFFSLSGAAGTGKTTVIRYFIEKMNINLDEIICAAYVGKAVTVLSSHGLPAKTIHSLIYQMIMIPEMDDNGDPILSKTGKVSMKMVFELKTELEYPYKLIVIDEASMVNDALRDDILSFGIPVIFIGDMNQLPPIFGQSTVMLKPDYVLTQIMRQAEDNPIIYLSQNILHGRSFIPGTYGESKILTSIDMDWNLLKDYDIILTAKNATRELFNNFIRFKLLKAESTSPLLGEKIICRQNNWKVSLGAGFFLTNGTAGTIERIYPETITKLRCDIDFKPDFTGMTVHELPIDYKYIRLPIDERKLYGLSNLNKFEYGYAITTHLSQGSQYPRVLFIDEFFHDAEDTKKMRYTAITRAIDNITIVTRGKRIF